MRERETDLQVQGASLTEGPSEIHGHVCAMATPTSSHQLLLTKAWVWLGYWGPSDSELWLKDIPNPMALMTLL